MIRGIDATARKQLPARPERLADWNTISDPEVRTAALKLAASFNWPGKTPGRAASVSLNAAERRLLEAGRRDYALCAACHLPTGQGMSGLAPPLVDSPWISGPAEILTRIVLHGKKEFNELPPCLRSRIWTTPNSLRS